MINVKEDQNLAVLNHSCAHLLAQAVKNIYPNAKFWVGPVIAEGFYYDMDLGDQSISYDDLEMIERVMHRTAKEGKLIKRIELTKEDALIMFKDDEYKLDLIDNLSNNEKITAYQQDDFIDLCRGPHIETTKELKYFKLLKVSGAYYKNDSNNKQLTRIYGICFSNQKQLNDYLEFLEEAKRRDHRRLGKELDLFMINEYAPGFPFFLNNGMIIRKELEDYWYKEHVKEGYQFIKTPIMLNKQLWEISGHWLTYKENMYTSEIDEKEFAIKPMNCPGGILVYKNSLHSYKDLPLRVGELGLVHRHEASGALNGLLRVRSFTQDDAHIYMMEEQIESEIIRLINFIDKVYKIFGLSYSIELSTRPENNFVGDIAIWNKAEKILEEACLKAGHKCKINPGDGAFYGPKLDFHIKDSLGRIWQCGTIQLDMNLPERFDLTYIAADGTKKRPILIHRVIYGSLERFLGILIEHFAGAFPTWLAPIQVNIVPINNSYHLEYSQKIKESLLNNNIRVNLDDSNEKLSYRIRNSQVKKIPFTIIIGNQEIEDNTISYRQYGSEKTVTLTLTEFIDMLEIVIENKELM
ncbi:MAG: threonine--tRNA ligase [Tenericutes bacterium]|jgi:threonyl-tRNA synthetase|nr:threonine--tRNA ligase [Mycoplasmatota bacterium]